MAEEILLDQEQYDDALYHMAQVIEIICPVKLRDEEVADYLRDVIQALEKSEDLDVKILP